MAVIAVIAAVTIVLISTGLPLPSKNEVQQDPEVLSLLETAEMHELVGRLCYPSGSNANETYRYVLEISPENKTAKDALVRLDCP